MFKVKRVNKNRHCGVVNVMSNSGTCAAGERSNRHDGACNAVLGAFAREEKKHRHASMAYAMTNSASCNEVIAFRRGKSGKLSRIDAFRTGGRGTGTAEVSNATPRDGVDPLASQGSLVLSRNGCLLFAVNAGSNSVSSFRVKRDGRLVLVDVDPSGGTQPNSLAVFGDLLYVANVGDAANNYNSNVSGFRVRSDGSLAPIPGSTRKLSTFSAQPACVVFSPDGRFLVVTELTTNRISVFRVNFDGTLSGPTVNFSSGEGPFGAVFLRNGVLLVAEAGANALSSYRIVSNGALCVISASVPNGQMATCWVAVSKKEHYAYVSNSASGNITIYRIKKDGRLRAGKNVSTTRFGSAVAPIDIGVSKGNLYALNGNRGSITVFNIRRNGRLKRIQVKIKTGLPRLGSQGLAVS